MHVNANETKPFKIDKSGRIILFRDKFKYLGSLINFLLHNAVDTLARIKAANEVMRVMNFI